MEEAQQSFDDFSIEMGDFEVKRVGEFDRMWKIGPGGSMCMIPLLHDGILYFGSCNHNMYAVNAKNGEVIWKFRAEKIIFESSPKYLNGNIYFGSFDYNFYCLDAKTGEMKWKFKTQSEIDASCCIGNGKVYFGSRDHILYCLDADTGKLIWKFETRHEIVAVPTYHEGKLLCGSFDKNLYCLDAETGQVLWKFQTQGEIHTMNPFAIHDGVVYFPSFDSMIRAVNLETGRLLWKFQTGQYGNGSSPQIYKGRLYNPSRDGFMFCLTLDGKQVWKFTNREHLATPSFYKDKMFFGSEDMNFYCFSLDGEKLWSYKTEGPTFISSVIHNGKVIFLGWDCQIRALDIETGKLAWKLTVDGSPSYLPPPYESFEMSMKIPEEKVSGEKRKDYVFDGLEEEQNVSAYKSRITYQISTQYSEKGKYQIDSDEEEF